MLTVENISSIIFTPHIADIDNSVKSSLVNTVVAISVIIGLVILLLPAVIAVIIILSIKKIKSKSSNFYENVYVTSKQRNSNLDKNDTCDITTSESSGEVQTNTPDSQEFIYTDNIDCYGNLNAASEGNTFS